MSINETKHVTRFYFGDVVVVEGSYIGCIVKTWSPSRSRGYHYEVYIRSWNRIEEYDEDQIQRFIVSKELDEEDEAWYAVKEHLG